MKTIEKRTFNVACVLRRQSRPCKKKEKRKKKSKKKKEEKKAKVTIDKDTDNTVRREKRTAWKDERAQRSACRRRYRESCSPVASLP
jgi:hypothetical protein